MQNPINMPCRPDLHAEQIAEYKHVFFGFIAFPGSNACADHHQLVINEEQSSKALLLQLWIAMRHAENNGEMYWKKMRTDQEEKKKYMPSEALQIVCA